GKSRHWARCIVRSKRCRPGELLIVLSWKASFRSGIAFFGLPFASCAIAVNKPGTISTDRKKPALKTPQSPLHEAQARSTGFAKPGNWSRSLVDFKGDLFSPTGLCQTKREPKRTWRTIVVRT